MKLVKPFWQHLVAFNLFWFLCVSFGNVMAWPLVILYVFIFRSALIQLRSRVDSVVVLVASVAIVVDVVMHAYGVISFSHAPTWLLPLWLGFLVSFSILYDALKTFPWWTSALLGAVFGPLSYYAGSTLHAVTVQQPLAYLIWSVLWAGTFVLLSKRLLNLSRESECC